MSHDIICFIETFQKFEGEFLTVFPNFECFENFRSVNNQMYGKASGGLLVLVKKSLLKYVKIKQILKKYADMIILHCQLGKNDVIFLFLYIPPENSIFYNYQNTDNGITIIEDVLFELQNMYGDIEIVLAGDFNARTAEIFEFASENNDNYNPGLHYIFDNGIGEELNMPKRKNKDKTVNTFGKSLIDLCSMYDLCIVNGRNKGDIDGNFTYVYSNGASTIDYFLTSNSLFKRITNMSVLNCDLSKHFPISCALTFFCNESMKTCTENTDELMKFRWNVNKSHCCKELYDDTESAEAVSNVLDLLEIDVNESVNCLIRLLQNICKKAGLLCINKGGKKICNQPDWFDKECQDLKIRKGKLLNDFRATSDKKILSEYIETKQHFQKLCEVKQKDKKQHKKEEIINAASSNDACKFWKLVKFSVNFKGKSETDISCVEWKQYFNDLLNPNITDKDTEFSDFVNFFMNNHDNNCQICDIELSFLDNDITEDEIICELKKLKNNKSPGDDGIPGELYKCLSTRMLPVLLKLFNKILQTGDFPESWVTAIIIPLYKKGDKNDCGNYRGISLLCVLSKIFMGVISKRLTLWSELNENIVEEQAGFRSGYSTIDNIFILTSIITKYLSKKKGVLYCAFIDFSKAFDCINRSKLFYLLINKNLHGNMIKLLQNIYSTVKARVKSTNGLSNTFNCNTGVRQGCVLSPWLFAMYINELANEMESNGGNGIFIHKDFHDLMLLLFADDLVLIADTCIDLQRRLNCLASYCDKWNMTVNMDKSNIVVFKNGGVLSKHEKWYYKDELLKVVSYYKYLGIVFSNRLKWTVCCRTLTNQCEKALNIIKHCLCKLNCKDINIGFKLFDSMAAPILYYGAEIWGLDKVNDIEAVQNRFCKWLLGIGMKTNNNIARGECGRYELFTNYLCRPIKYFLRLQRLESNRLPQLCYKMMYEANRHGRKNWCTKIQTVLFMYGFGEVWENQGVENEMLFFEIFKQRLKDVCFQNWSEYLSNSSKCEFYTKVKDGISVNENIQKLSYNLRWYIYSILCSNHKLAIEKGRHENIPRENRLCQLCNYQVVEDEYHFVLICPMLADVRKCFLPSWCQNHVCTEKLVTLFKSKDVNILRNLAIFIKRSLLIREEMLSI